MSVSVADVQSELPFYISSLELENVRCFGTKQSFSLIDDNDNPVRWNLILGDNGVGKTTLLQCLAWMRPVPTRDEEGAFIEPALNGEENPVLKSLIRLGGEIAANLKAVYSVGQTLGSAESNSHTAMMETEFRIHGEDGILKDIAWNRIDIEKIELSPPQDPPIFGYGATRCPGTLILDRAGLSDPLASLFDSRTELYDAEDILLKLDYRAAKSQTTQDKERLEDVKGIVASILPDLGSADDIFILAPEVFGRASQPSGVLFRTPYGAVPLRSMSLGYQTTLTWVLDLALRLYEYYPNHHEPLGKPSVVLIDNIDLHLHPKWQRRLIEDLSACFPATQFIATAHSPLIVQAAEDANLVVLRQEAGQVLIEKHSQSVKDWRADQILSSDLFDVPTRGPFVEKVMRERDALLDKTDRDPEEEAKLNALETVLEESPTAVDPKDREAMSVIRRVADALEKNR